MPKTDISVRELVDKVKHGDLALPEMQRAYCWPATRVRDLLDSLYRGYPSGAILVWETDDDVQTRVLSVRPTNTPTTGQRLLLLDGQQRVTSLTAILEGEPVHVRGRKRPIDILFNLEHPEGAPTEVTEVDENDHSGEDTEDDDGERDIQEEIRQRTFVVSGRALKNDPLWVPVSDIFKKTDKEILQPVGITSADEKWDKYSARLQKVRGIANYQYVMQVLEKNMSYEEVTEIFVRVNSLGIKLRGSDLALAQISSRWPGFTKLVEDFSVEFGDDGDYLVETGLLVRVLVAMATGQIKFKTVGKISETKLKESWIKATDGIRFAINFVRENAGIDDLDYLSSPFLLVPIAMYWVSKEGKSFTQIEEHKLLKWLFNAHMRGHYSMGSSESILDADLSILRRTKSLDELVNQLHLHVKKFDVDVSDIVGKGIRSPFFSMLYFILKNEGAKDWWSGLKLSERYSGKSHLIQYHHIFPKALLKEAKYEKKEINEMANMAFIGGTANRKITDKEPREYLKEVVKARGEDSLASQKIPMDKALWEIDKYLEFLSWRRQAIADAINVFMKKYA